MSRVLVMTDGAYSEYGIVGWLEIPDDFNAKEAAKEFLQAFDISGQFAYRFSPDDRSAATYARLAAALGPGQSGYWYVEHAFVEWLRRAKNCRDAAAEELHLGDTMTEALEQRSARNQPE